VRWAAAAVGTPPPAGIKGPKNVGATLTAPSSSWGHPPPQNESERTSEEVIQRLPPLAVR